VLSGGGCYPAALVAELARDFRIAGFGEKVNDVNLRCSLVERLYHHGLVPRQAPTLSGKSVLSGSGNAGYIKLCRFEERYRLTYHM
jgi:hypothetical protein